MSYKISIPQPCGAPQEAMTPTACGQFCAQCQKEVIDFRRASDREIIRHLERRAGTTCGKFLPAQLDRPLHRKPHRHTSKWLTSLLALLPLLPTGNIMAQQVLTPTEQVTSRYSEEKTKCHSCPPDPQTILTGTVVDQETGEILVGATVILRESPESPDWLAGAAVDANGTFSIPLQAEWALDTFSLMVSMLGFERYHMMIASSHTQELSIRMKPADIELMGAVVIIRPRGIRGLVYRLGIPFRRVGHWLRYH